MIISNWMEPDPITVAGDTPVTEAQRLIQDKRLRYLCVVDDGRLRGVLTRKGMAEAAAQVARTQNIHEVDYFVNHLKVKDVMRRMPETVSQNDTVEYSMIYGRQKQVSFFPVMDGKHLVGVITEYEISRALAQILGTEESWRGITLAPMKIEAGTLGRIAAAAEKAGGCLMGVFTLSIEGGDEKKVILRFTAEDLQAVVDALKGAGYDIFEVTSDITACEMDQEKVVC
ncbi:MAG: CBS domain-containing protein [Proteobacteria bacterium]|nr:CBS domain-containing protein [Pseudomonadota bacterium]